MSYIKNGQSNVSKDQRAFTLIEVVLVLAIGGLIFLLAFLAYQRVSANRRDTQTRQDVVKIIAELQNNFNSTGGYPDNVSSFIAEGTSGLCTPGTAMEFRTFIANHMCKNGEFQSPSGVAYGLANSSNPATPPPVNRIKYNRNLVCGSETASSGSVRVTIVTEGGAPICRDIK